MSNIIELKRGLNIPIAGAAVQKAKKVIIPDVVAVKPTDFRGLIPRLLVREGDTVLAGSPVFADKVSPEILFTSPVSGTVKEIVRGEKRKLLEVRIEADKTVEYVDFGIKDPEKMNAAEIKEKLVSVGCNFAATNDSEVISSLIGWEALRGESIEDAVADAARQLRGAFSLVVLSSRNKLIAFRDGAGFRPLCLGKNDHGWAVASESCGLDSAGFTFVRDIRPGEMVIIHADRTIESRMVIEHQKKGLCIFEYVYFARTDSVIDGLSVYNARIAMGRQLAQEYPVDADMVCGVPDSGLEAAMGYAQQSGLPYQHGFVKNRYIGRSFIFPSQQQRDAAVRLKLNPLSVNLKGKRVVLVDDSIVRGTTSAKIIKSLKQAGASEVHLRISSPPFKHTCHFGTDIDSEENLIANQLELDAICRRIGADSLGFISIDGLKQACEGCGLSFCTGCFTGEYPVDIGSSHTKAQFEDISSGGTGQF